MLTERIIETIRAYSMIEKGDNVTAALSGGADSVCLLLVLKELSGQIGFTVDAIHINHCIRGEESDRDEEFCIKLCKRLEIPLTLNRSDIPKHARAWGKSIEETAREIRYAYFGEHLIRSDKIATAHTASDNVETMLLNLIRGTGLKGLCGIPPVRGHIIRPLIDVTRQQVEEYLKEKNQGYVTDSTNLSDDYTRNRIRHKIVPEILKINSGFYKTYTAEKDIFKEENEFISKSADAVYSDSIKDGRLIGADQIPEALRRRVIARFLKFNNIPASYDKIKEVSALSVKNGKINIKKGVYIAANNGIISIEHEKEKYKEVQIPLKPGRNSVFEGRVLIAEENNCGGDLIDLDKTHGQIILRNRRYGDKIKLSGRSFTSSVKKLLNENIPSHRRSAIHFLADDEGLIYAETFGVADRVKVTGETTRILSVKTEDVI